MNFTLSTLLFMYLCFHVNAVDAADSLLRRGTKRSTTPLRKRRSLAHSKGKQPPPSEPPTYAPTPSSFFQPPSGANVLTPFPNSVPEQQILAPQFSPEEEPRPTENDIPLEPVDGATSEDSVRPTENAATADPIETTENPITEAPIEPTENPDIGAPIEATENPLTETPIEPTENPVTEAPIEPTENTLSTRPVEAIESTTPPDVADPTNDNPNEADNIFKPDVQDSNRTVSGPVHASCEAAQRGEVFETEVSQIVEINYELLTVAGSPLSMVTSLLDGQFQARVASTLVDCSMGVTSDIQGVDVASQSTVIDMNCRQITGYDKDQNFCFVMKGALTVYKSNSTIITPIEVRDMVWSTLREAINGPSATRRRLQANATEFVNAESGIVDLYFLNREGSAFSQVNQGASTQTTGEGISKGASATLLGIVFVMICAIALVYARRRRDKDAHSYMQKMTEVGDGNSYQQDSDFHGSPNDSHSSDRNLRKFFGNGIDPITPSTPSQLSCPTSSSASDDFPSMSMFEAYEATPAESDDHFVDSRLSGSHRMRKDEIHTIASMRSTSILNISDELLEQPPIFMSKTPRTARSNPGRAANSPNSKRYNSATNACDKRDSLRTTPSRPDPPRITKPPKEYYDPSEDSEEQAAPNKGQPLDDSFSVTAFLNGHCAAMESFHLSAKPDVDEQERKPTNPSPTSVCSLWSDPKTPPASMIGKSYKSSVSIWTSQCDSNTQTDDDDDDVEPWSTNALKYFNSFSPYGNNGEPSVAQMVSKFPCEEHTGVLSPDRGRSPTAIDDSTNNTRDVSSSKTPSRLYQNPPGRRVKTPSEPQQRGFKHRSSSSDLRSSAARSPSSRYVTPSSTRGAISFPVYEADTVEL